MNNAIKTGARFCFKSSLTPVTVSAVVGEMVRFDNGNVMPVGILTDGLARGFWKVWTEATVA